MKSFLHLAVDIYEELKPGEYITNDGTFKYYSLKKSTWLKDPISKISDRVKHLVENAIIKRVQTDLPIAVFLSGGIDSSIVYLLSRKYHPNVTAIIIGEDTAEDVIYAKRLCGQLNSKFHHININKKDLLKTIDEVIFTIESFETNPIRGSILSMKLSECAHNLGFKVVLCGEGSDEIFGGYGDFLLLHDENEFQNKIISLLNDLYRSQLLRIDRTSMHYGVEVREPFLDRLLVEYVMDIHPDMKVAINNDGRKTTKYILREAFKDILPDYIYSREKMTLMEGAGTGSLAKGEGIVVDFANDQIGHSEFKIIKNKYSDYKLIDKEEVYCFKVFYKYFSKAKFAINRIINGQKEIVYNNGY